MLSIKNFRREIRNYYRAHKRDFPWRRTRNPYRILVSEIMLQQTQTSRVELKYVFRLGEERTRGLRNFEANCYFTSIIWSTSNTLLAGLYYSPSS